MVLVRESPAGQSFRHHQICRHQRSGSFHNRRYQKCYAGIMPSWIAGKCRSRSYILSLAFLEADRGGSELWTKPWRM